MRSDYGKWFVSVDKSGTALKCTRERFSDYLREMFGPVKAAELVGKFRRATFEEFCRLELDELEG